LQKRPVILRRLLMIYRWSSAHIRLCAKK